MENTSETLEQLKTTLQEINMEIRNSQSEINAKIEDEKIKLAKLRECVRCNERVKSLEQL